MKHTVTFSPFTRVEGDLRIAVDVADGCVTEARVTGTLYRGFEALLRGREPGDALVMTCRICGQCGASHSAAAAAALAALTGLTPPPNGLLCRNILQAAETVLNHLTHFYLSFGADLAHPRYGPEMARLFAPIKGESFRQAMAARRAFLALLGLVAGKWPNTLAIQPGGVTKTLDRWELARAKGVLAELCAFVERRMLAGPLDEFVGLESAAELDGWLGRDGHAASDVGRFVTAALAFGLDRLGRGPQRFLDAGGYPDPHGMPLFSGGYYDGEVHPFDPSAVMEHARFAWLESEPAGRHPFDGATQPAPDKAEAYTWCKAPRYDGWSVEVGPMARAFIAGVPLARDLVRCHGPGVLARMVLRLREMFRLIHGLGTWLHDIDPEEPFCVPAPPVVEGQAAGLVAAPRGLLGHWVRVEKGRIRNYQVVTPTTWNLSPRDTEGAPGPLEEALVGTPADGPDGAVNIAHVVRSFDPCLFCTVH